MTTMSVTNHNRAEQVGNILRQVDRRDHLIFILAVQLLAGAERYAERPESPNSVFDEADLLFAEFDAKFEEIRALQRKALRSANMS